LDRGEPPNIAKSRSIHFADSNVADREQSALIKFLREIIHR